VERDWRDAVFRIDSAAKDRRDFGTGFVCFRDATKTYLLTCHHVIEAIGEADARIQGKPIEVVKQGDDTLDLALIKVEGLTETPVLPLGSSGEQGRAFEIFGHTWADLKKKSIGTTISRPLQGRLGSDTVFTSRSGDKVPAWDLPFDKEDEFAELLEGYSGSPVWDPVNQQVIAVVSHRRGTKMGYAIAVSNLLNIHPAAKGYFQLSSTAFAGNGTDQEGEYAYEDDWVVQMIDHREQWGKVVDHIDPTSSGQPDRAYFYFDATPDDCPLALADHTYIVFARLAPETNNFATELRRYGRGRNAIWKALLQKLPGGRDQGSRQEAQQRVLDWINSRRLTVLYVIADAERERKHLPEMIKGACAALDALPRFQEGVRLILFFACLKASSKRSVFQLISGLIPGPKITDMCCALDPLRKLNRVDIEEWLSGFTPEQNCRYHKERLSVELGEFLKEQDKPYETVRSYLIDGGVLRRARK
jgi:hypothetical protein